MNFKSGLQNMRKIDLVVIAVIAIFLVFPVYIPPAFIPFIENPLTLVLFFVGIVYTFFFYSPIIGVLSIFLVYEILRRNFSGPTRSSSTATTFPQQNQQQVHQAAASNMNPPEMNAPYTTNLGEGTLEVDVISRLAPVSPSTDTTAPNAPYLLFVPPSSSLGTAATSY